MQVPRAQGSNQSHRLVPGQPLPSRHRRRHQRPPDPLLQHPNPPTPIQPRNRVPNLQSPLLPHLPLTRNQPRVQPQPAQHLVQPHPLAHPAVSPMHGDHAGALGPGALHGHGSSRGVRGHGCRGSYAEVLEGVSGEGGKGDGVGRGGD